MGRKVIQSGARSGRLEGELYSQRKTEEKSNSNANYYQNVRGDRDVRKSKKNTMLTLLWNYSLHPFAKFGGKFNQN